MQICTLIVLQYNKKKNKEHIHIFIANDITKKLTLVCRCTRGLQEIYL